MAKPGVLESDPGVMVKKAKELKRELQRLVKSIVHDEDCSTETIDQAKETLCVLKELKLRNRSSLSLKLHNKSVASSCPDEFKCPLSKELMRDPVIVASGQVSVTIFKCITRILNLPTILFFFLLILLF